MLNVVYLETRLLANCGPINQAFNLATGFKHLQDCVNFSIVCMFRERGDILCEDKFKLAGIKIIHLEERPLSFFICWMKLRRYVRENDVQIVHSSGFWPDLCNVLLGRNVKHVTTQRSEPNLIGEKFSALVSKVSAKVMLHCLKKMDLRIACSQSLADKIWRVHSVKCDVVQNSVDICYYKAIDSATRIAYRKRLSLPQDKFIFTYMGPLIERKNISHIIQASNYLDDNILLLFIGGPSSYLNKFSALNSSKILFLGPLTLPLQYLQCSDYYISASKAEGLPNSVLESLSCGIPLILSDIEPHLEILECGNVGTHFSNNDGDSIVNAIQGILSLDRDNLRKNCIDVAKKFFSKYVIAKKYLEEYYTIVHK